jgi:hypothetical protein
MMKEKRLKYIFLASSLFLLIVMLLLSGKAGISCDEVLHYNQSRAVCNYFTSHGADRSALETPATNLKYYGQSYDNIVTIIAKWTGIDDIYSFRHIMSTLAGWLAIFMSALLAIWISGYRSGILVIFLFAISPTFLGHSQNNLKDIPFALGCISSLYFTLRFLFPKEKVRFPDIILLVISIAFTISIRAGGLLMICYLFLFAAIVIFVRYFKGDNIRKSELARQSLLLVMISAAAFFMGILLWPFALESPLKNVFESYHVMAHFPSTFREIFEGRREWSDFMPWYYLPKYMVITIPLLVLAGPLFFIFYFRKFAMKEKYLAWLFVVFTILFPVAFAIFNKSNIYSGWRQFLFVYPPLIVLSAVGFSFLFERVQKRLFRWVILIFLFLLAIDPVRYMASNKSFMYIYFNQLTGGLRGAYGRYEIDYYYIGQTSASQWLIAHLDSLKLDSAKVMATYPVDWQFRKKPGITTFYGRNEERSQSDWDYAIVSSRYVEPEKLKKGSWPPPEAIHVVYADGIPVCAVLQRQTHEDFKGYAALEAGYVDEAIKSFREALKINWSDEMIFYNFARALRTRGLFREADSALIKGLSVNPVCEPILMYAGRVAVEDRDSVRAEMYFEKLLKENRKYYDAYIGLAGVIIYKDVLKSRELLRTCLRINPRYVPAIEALADSYRKSSPDMAKKYDELANSIKQINIK